LFTSVLEAKLLTEDYRLDYNHRRPHSSLTVLLETGKSSAAGFSAKKGGSLGSQIRLPE
jgi:transposase InsO family protein